MEPKRLNLGPSRVQTSGYYKKEIDILVMLYRLSGFYVGTYMYMHVTYVTTINKKRGHEFQREQGTREYLEGGKRREK